MRIRIETIPVPASTYEETYYGCDHCDFETQDEDACKSHHAKTHAVKKEQTVNGEKFYWFDTEDDAKLWLDPPGDHSIVDFTYVNWTGPGWYGAEHTEGHGRCRCGGCSYFETTLHPLAFFIERWRKDVTTRPPTKRGSRASRPP